MVVSEERNTLTGCKEGLVWESKVLFFFGSSSFLDLTKILRFFIFSLLWTENIDN